MPDDEKPRNPYEVRGTQYGIPFGSPGNLLRRDSPDRGPSVFRITALVVGGVVLVCLIVLVVVLAA